MTITPTAPLPAAPAGPATPANGDTATTAVGFGALIAEQLGLLADPAVVPGEPAEDAAPATVESETDEANPCPDLAAGYVAVGLPVPAAVPVPTAPAPAAAPADGPEPTAAEVVTGPVAAAPTSPEATVAAPDKGPVSPDGVRPLRTTGTPDNATDPGAPAEVAPTDATEVTQQPAAPAPAAESAPRTDGSAPAPAPVVVATPTVGSVPVAATPTDAPAPVPNPVLDQVTPAFSRLVSGPEGTHRMMLRLHPADLGEVHLTVTVRGDTVDVTVAASPEARELLTDGSSQLRGLLDAVGRSAGQIVFRDLPGTGSTVQVIQTGTGGPNPDGQPAASYDGTGRSDGSGAHGDERGDGGRHEPAAAREGSTSSDNRTTHPTRTSAAGLVRGGLDVRM